MVPQVSCSFQLCHGGVLLVWLALLTSHLGFLSCVLDVSAHSAYVYSAVCRLCLRSTHLGLLICVRDVSAHSACLDLLTCVEGMFANPAHVRECHFAHCTTHQMYLSS